MKVLSLKIQKVSRIFNTLPSLTESMWSLVDSSGLHVDSTWTEPEDLLTTVRVYWSPYGLHVDFIWSVCYFITLSLLESIESLLESMWTPYGLHRDFVIFFSREFTGVYVESMWTP